MVDIVTRVNNVVNGFVWGPFGLALLLCTGLWLSVRTGFFQFRRMGYWLKHTIGAIFTNKDVTAHTSKEDMAISQFQSMCTALAGTIGTGNIVGVATAIVSGGPGAIFWMWVMALLGMMTSFAENVLGVYYRRKNEKGEWSGGAMYYLTDGLGAKPGCKAVGRVLAVLFACFCILASFGIGNMSQINSIAGNMNAAFHVPYLATGLALMVVTALIVIGGLKRVAAVTEKLVPLMALFYVVSILVGAQSRGLFELSENGGVALLLSGGQTCTAVLLDNSLGVQYSGNVPAASHILRAADGFYLLTDSTVECFNKAGEFQWTQPMDAKPQAGVLNGRQLLVFSGNTVQQVTAPEPDSSSAS